MNENNVSIRWFFLPPFTALLTIVVANGLSSGQPVPVDPAVWGLVGLLFVVLTILYGLFLHHDFTSGLFPVQLIAQGLLLCPLSLNFGAHMLQWVGVTMAVCGSVVLVVIYYRSRALFSQRIVVETAPSAEFSSLPLPFVVTDEEGTIVVVSDALLHLTNRTREATEGQKVTLFLPLDRDTVVLGEKEWKILQSPMKNTSTEGNRFYFQLEELHEPKATSFTPHASGETFLDPTTSLFSRAYAQRRVIEELYRVRRYQRWIAAALLRMNFSYTGPEQPQQEDAIFLAYCTFVKKSTREADITCLVGPQDILLVMPETELTPALEVVSKLSDFAAEIEPVLNGFNGIANVSSGTAFFDAASGNLDFDSFLSKLDQELDRSEKRFS